MNFKSIVDRNARFFTENRKKVLVVILIIGAVFAYGATRIKGDILLQDLFPHNHPYLKLHARFSELFGSGASTGVICLRSKKGDIFNEVFLTKLKKMTEEIEMWNEVYRSLTFSIASRSAKIVGTRGKGEIAVEPLMLKVPKTPEEMERLKKNIFSSSAYNGTMVSRDGTAALILTEFRENISYEQAHKILQQLVKQYSDENLSINIIGFPSLMGWIYSLKPQIYLVFGISIAAMIVVLYLIFFGNFLGVIVVMANAAILTLWGLGFIGFTRINFSPLLYVLAFLVGARMIGNAHQITYRYFEELHSNGNDRAKACYETMRSMLIPNFAAVAADVAGFLVLFLAEITLMQQLAFIMSFWMATILLTGVLVPIICTLVPFKVASEKWAKESCQIDWMARTMMKMSQFSISPVGKYVVGILIIGLMVVCSWQMTKLKIGDPTPGSPILWPNHTYNKDQALIDKTFDASSENLMLFYEGRPESVYDPEVLHTFEAFDRYMKERLPDIYKSSTSLNNLAKMVNVIYHDGNVVWEQLPRNNYMMQFVIGQVSRNSGSEVLYRFIDTSRERAQITLFFADHTSENLERIRKAAYDFFKVRPMKIDKGDFKLAGGRIGLEMAVNEEMKRSHIMIDLAVYIGIFILCAFFYMSFTAALMLTLPLILANSVAGAYMALEGIGLSINTLPVAAIGAGVGVDFAIYLYSRCIEEFDSQGRDWERTIIQSICTCGKAVVYTGLTVILPIITWYFLSDMKFQAEVGFFLSIIMGVNVILTLTLHPLIIYIIKPKFISRNTRVDVSEEQKMKAMNPLEFFQMKSHSGLSRFLQWRSKS